jgi:serine/threonine protein kinase
LGAGIDRRLEGGLPSSDAFDHVRRAASKAGFSVVLFLFDEAQVLFPRGSGSSLGDLLKSRLEGAWALQKKGMVPVAFGLVGLPSLQERAGANLLGLLRPSERSTLEEADLNRLVLRFTRNKLHTTREARHTLAQRSRNIFILKTLLEPLVQRANEENRQWVSYDDVKAVETQLRHELEQGGAATVASYVRDILNDGDTNEWDPNPALPVALALASARRTLGRVEGDLFDRCSRLLDDWCEQATTDSFGHPTYSRDRFNEHLDTLRERGVFADGAFTSQLFESWLVGLARSGYPPDEAARRALLNGAMVRVRVPSPLDPPRGEGAEAEVRTYQDPRGVRLAVRRGKLRDKEAHRRFLQTADALEKLKMRVHSREAGSEYVFDLQQIGLSADDDSTAVMIYRWVEGEDLQARVHKLPPMVVADIGYRLALGVKLLHSLGILHRDIRPRNIVLAEEEGAGGGIRPVLIDFGLARLEEGDLRTSIGHEYSAPEVQTEAPAWSRAADIFSLGRVLLQLLSRQDPAVLDALQATQSMNPGDRPSAETLVEHLQQLIRRLNLDKERQALRERILHITSADREKRWYRELVEKFMGRFESLSLGLYTDAYERCAHLADFANQVVEAASPERANLGSLETALGSQVGVLYALRTWRNHGNVQLRSKLRRFKVESDEHLRRMSLAGLTQVADHLKLASLAAIGNEFIAE